MNALVPVLAVVIAAELGSPLRMLATSERPGLVAAAAGLLVSAAAAGGAALAAAMTPWAELLLVAFALGFAGASRFGAPARAPRGNMAGLLVLWRSSAPFAAFAFSAWLGDPVGAGAGALAGLALAAMLPVALPRSAAAALAVVLLVAGAASAVSALRLG